MNIKHLSVVLLLLGLAGCKYPSRIQADNACDEWKGRVSKATYIRDYTDSEISEAYEKVEKEYPYYETAGVLQGDGGKRRHMIELKSVRLAIKKGITETKNARWCRLEEDTNQYLGYEEKRDDKGKLFSTEIVKYFRY